MNIVANIDEVSGDSIDEQLENVVAEEASLIAEQTNIEINDDTNVSDLELVKPDAQETEVFPVGAEELTQAVDGSDLDADVEELSVDADDANLVPDILDQEAVASENLEIEESLADSGDLASTPDGSDDENASADAFDAEEAAADAEDLVLTPVVLGAADDEGAQGEESDKSADGSSSEVTGETPSGKSSRKKLGIIIGAAVAVVAIAVAIIVGMSISAKNAYNQYIDDLKSVEMDMLSECAKAEDIGNDVQQIWTSAIWDDRKSEWDKKYQKYYAKDFNDALTLYFSDPDVSANISAVRGTRDSIGDRLEEMSDPPKGCEDAYQAAMDFYDKYSDLVSIVTSPTGSLMTFSSEFGSADNAAARACEKATQKIPNKKE